MRLKPTHSNQSVGEDHVAKRLDWFFCGWIYASFLSTYSEMGWIIWFIGSFPYMFGDQRKFTQAS